MSSSEQAEHRAHPFRGKKIAITGAGSGIGRSLAVYLVERGASLSLCDINLPPLEELAGELETKYGTTVGTFKVDVSDRGQVDEWVANSLGLSPFGVIHGAANMAGTIGPKRSSNPIANTDDAEWDAIMDVNARGTFNCLRAQLNAVVIGGAIVNAASIAGHQGRPMAGAYTASKHAVLGLTRTAAKEAGERGVRVNAVAPGYVDTPMMVYVEEEVKATALGRVGKPEEVAALVAFLLGDESRFITGAVYSIDGGWHC